MSFLRKVIRFPYTVIEGWRPSCMSDWHTLYVGSGIFVGGLAWSGLSSIRGLPDRWVRFGLVAGSAGLALYLSTALKMWERNELDDEVADVIEDEDDADNGRPMNDASDERSNPHKFNNPKRIYPPDKVDREKTNILKLNKSKEYICLSNPLESPLKSPSTKNKELYVRIAAALKTFEEDIQKKTHLKSKTAPKDIIKQTTDSNVNKNLYGQIALMLKSFEKLVETKPKIQRGISVDSSAFTDHAEVLIQKYELMSSVKIELFTSIVKVLKDFEFHVETVSKFKSELRKDNSSKGGIGNVMSNECETISLNHLLHRQIATVLKEFESSLDSKTRTNTSEVLTTKETSANLSKLNLECIQPKFQQSLHINIAGPLSLQITATPDSSAIAGGVETLKDDNFTQKMDEVLKKFKDDSNGEIMKSMKVYEEVESAQKFNSGSHNTFNSDLFDSSPDKAFLEELHDFLKTFNYEYIPPEDFTKNESKLALLNGEHTLKAGTEAAEISKTTTCSSKNLHSSLKDMFKKFDPPVMAASRQSEFIAERRISPDIWKMQVPQSLSPEILHDGKESNDFTTEVAYSKLPVGQVTNVCEDKADTNRDGKTHPNVINEVPDQNNGNNTDFKTRCQNKMAMVLKVNLDSQTNGVTNGSSKPIKKPYPLSLPLTNVSMENGSMKIGYEIVPMQSCDGRMFEDVIVKLDDQEESTNP